VTDCIVEDAKVRDYLLNLDHEDGATKAKFFIAGGFARDEPAPFIAALRQHFLENTPTSKKPGRFGGVRIRVDGLFPMGAHQSIAHLTFRPAKPAPPSPRPRLSFIRKKVRGQFRVPNWPRSAPIACVSAVY
jgi:hypothetical protein